MSLPPGAVFAGFTIERLLGAGGMGTVYLAEHPRLQRRVALKVLANTFTVDAKTRAAFDREATLAAGLDHPNIVPVYDRSAEEDPALWLAMRYLDGGDASVLLKDHPDGLAPERAVSLVADAAHALDYAHAQGVLHRDVKPANLLLDNDRRHGERAVLTDFGIARTLDDTVTLSGVAATFAYAAPERFSDEPADHRSDIYSLGCTLFQLLTGQQPFARKDQAAVIGAHLTAPPPSPHALRAELPAELDLVIATALAKSPQDRYPTCTALAEAAASALAPAAATVHPEAAQPVVVSGSSPTAQTEVPASLHDAVPRSEQGAVLTIARDAASVPAPARDEAAIPTVIRRAAPPIAAQQVLLEKRFAPVAEITESPTPDTGRSARRRRFAMASGLLLTGVSVVVGAALAVRGNSESPPATSPGTSSAAMSQQVTPTTTQVPSNPSVTSAPAPAAETPPPVETLPVEPVPPAANVPTAEQSVPIYTAPRAQPPANEAPAVVPQTRAHQFPG